MKTLDIKKANGSLAHYALKVQKEPILVTDKGQPLATLTFVGDLDAPEPDLSKNPQFMAMLDKSYADYKAHGGYTSEEIRRMFGLKSRNIQSAKPISTARAPKAKNANRG